jgi:hypothetical protein
MGAYNEVAEKGKEDRITLLVFFFFCAVDTSVDPNGLLFNLPCCNSISALLYKSRVRYANTTDQLLVSEAEAAACMAVRSSQLLDLAFPGQRWANAERGQDTVDQLQRGFSGSLSPACYCFPQVPKLKEPASVRKERLSPISLQGPPSGVLSSLRC